MLMEQIIKKQTISILDTILQTQSLQSNDKNQENHEKSFTPQQYVQLYSSNNVIKQDEGKILLILINNYLEKQNSNNQFQTPVTSFTQDQAYSIIKSIKKTILQPNTVQQANKKSNQQNSVQNHKQISPELNKTIQQPTSAKSPNISHQIIQKQPSQQQTESQVSKMSKKLKKQNQFITRNIDRIKKYATNLNQSTLLLQKSQLQEIKISHEISHKLFNLYKPIYPSGMSSNNQIEINNFQTKELYKSSLNYHKILEMFIEASIKLEIQNKLSLLRIIKKFAFNPNFIQLQEWTKIYKAIINNLGVKEVALQRLVKHKEEEKKNVKFTINLISKDKSQKPQYRSRRIKTEASLPEPRLTSMASINSIPNQHQSHKNIEYMTNKSAIRPIEPSKNQPKTYNPNEYRSRHKKLLTDVSEVFIKNVKKDLKSEKMIGLEESGKKQDKNSSQILGEELRKNHSYLKKAIQNKKIGKITWETLFEMKEDTMYHNIVIPQFAKLLDQENS